MSDKEIVVQLDISINSEIFALKHRIRRSNFIVPADLKAPIIMTVDFILKTILSDPLVVLELEKFWQEDKLDREW